MDHMYAAVSPTSKAEAVAKPTTVFSCLHDHSFARPASESPQVPESTRPVRSTRGRNLSSGQDDGQHASAKSAGKKQTAPAKSPTKAQPSQTRSSTEEQSVSAKPGKKGRRRSRRSSQQSKSPAVAEEEEEEDDGEFVPVGTMASAPNSPAGMRSLLAEHLLSARATVPGSEVVSRLVFEPAEEVVTTQDEGGSHGLADEGENNNRSHVQERQECLADVEMLDFNEAGTGVHSNEGPLLQGPQTSSTLPNVRSLLTGQNTLSPVSQSSTSQNKQSAVDHQQDTSDDSVSLPSNLGKGNPLGESSGSGTVEKDDSHAAEAKTLHKKNSRSNSASQKISENSSVTDSVGTVTDSVGGVTDSLVDDAKKSEDLGAEKTKSHKEKQRSVTSPGTKTSSDSTSSPHSHIGCSISEAVKLRQLALRAAKEQNGVHETKGTRVSSRKRSAKRASLDSSQSEVSDAVTQPKKASLDRTQSEVSDALKEGKKASLDSPKSEVSDALKEGKKASLDSPKPEVSDAQEGKKTSLDSPKSEVLDALKEGKSASLHSAQSEVSDALKEGKNASLDSTQSEVLDAVTEPPKASLDSKQSEVSDGLTESPQTPSKSSLRKVLTESLSPKSALEEMLTHGTPSKSPSKDASTKTSTPSFNTATLPERKESKLVTPPQKKAKLPKADSNDLPFDVEPYLSPMIEHGWKRELVFRGTFDEDTKRKNPPADVYYFTPEGRKLRSRVMIGDYLQENPTPGLSVDNFTFFKKPISEEPFEVVRQAGKNVGRKAATSSPKVVVCYPSPSQKQKVKIKMGAGYQKQVTVETEPSTSGTPLGKTSRKVSRSYDAASKSSFIHPDDISDYEAELDEDDEEYDPYDGAQTPNWNKTRVFGKPRGRKGTKDREILIQSLPEPDIIIDRAEESPHFVEGDLQRDEGDGLSESPGKPPRMMLLPGDIKEELLSEEEGGGKDREDGSDIGTVHIHRSPPRKPVRHKPTARKSTMPRIMLKKNSSTKSKEVALADGQLCSNNCPGLDGVPPTLQCCVCMCLFHHQCVNIHPEDKSAWQTPQFKCLRCRDLPSGQHIDLPQSESSPSPNTSNFIITSVSSAFPMITSAQATRLVYVHTPLPSGPNALPNTASTTTALLPPLMALSAKPAMNSGVLQAPPRMDAIRVLRNLGSVAAAPVAPQPPQLIRGGAAPPSVHSSRLPIPTLRPPRLTAAPGVVPGAQQTPTPTTATVMVNSAPPGMTQVSQPQPQIMTLPVSLVSQLNLSQPLAVKLNNTQVVVPPSCIINSPDGLKVLLPPSTFPVPSGSNAKVSVTVSNNASNSSANNTTTSPSSPGTSSAGKDCQLARPSSSSSHDGISSKGSESSDRVQTRKRRNKRSPPRIHFTQCTMHRLFGGFDCMLQIFHFLSVRDLLRAGQVCRTWRQISRQKQLWHRVSLSGLYITHWKRATQCLHSCGTQSLCLLDMHHNSTSDSDWILSWNQLLNNLDSLIGLRNIEFGLVPAVVLHKVAEVLPKLEVLRAERISDHRDENKWCTRTKLEIGKLARLEKLRELRLRGVSGLSLPPFAFSGSLATLARLKRLHTLSLTSLSALRGNDYQFLSEMQQLEVLELGDCLYWTAQTYRLLGELQNLRHLKLVCGGDIPDTGIGNAIAKLTKLERLELILFAIPATMESALSQLPHLETVVIWPYSSHGLMPALVNSHALVAVVGLKQVKSLTWGVVMHRNEGDQEHLPPSPTSSDAHCTIPLLKPGASLDCREEHDSSVVVNVSVTAFTEKLCRSLPSTTEIKVFNTQVVGTAPYSM